MKILIALIIGIIIGLFSFQCYHNYIVKISMNTIEPIMYLPQE